MANTITMKGTMIILATVLALVAGALVQTRAEAKPAAPAGYLNPPASKDLPKAEKAQQIKITPEMNRALSTSTKAFDSRTTQKTAITSQASDLGHSGYVGPHRLQDNPGALCRRDNVSLNGVIVVNAPLVWANRAYTSGQTVGYQVQVLRSDHLGGGYTNRVFNGPVVYRKAYPNVRASFPNTALVIPPSGYAQNYHVRVFMYWFNNSGYRQGYSVHQVDNFYTSTFGSAYGYQPYYCRM